jgi:enoyl-CoA hydratase
MLLAGRQLDAQESLALGLLGEIVDPSELLPAARRLAHRIASMDATATIATKAVLAAARDEHPDIDLRQQAALFESPEKHRRMTEFLERRTRSQQAGTGGTS